MRHPQSSQATSIPTRPAKGKLFSIVIALSVLGLLQAAAVTAYQGSASSGERQEIIQDPVFNMDAVQVFIPAKWHLQGAIVQGTQCNPVPFEVFRTSSPDSLSVLERLPRVDWVGAIVR